MASKELNLVINPGSTSTKLGVFKEREMLHSQTRRHTQAELAPYKSVYAEREFRMQTALDMLAEAGLMPSDFGGVISIAGRIKPGPSGPYEVNGAMLADLREAKYKEHASNLGAFMAAEFAKIAGVKAYVADAVTVDEFEPVARLSGMPELERHGSCHTVNQKRMARKAAAELGLEYEKARIVVCHLGGGISVVAHKYGRMVDGNVPMGEGPFCIDRTGGLNSYELVQMCYSGKYTHEEMSRKIRGDGGVSAYLRTRDFKDVCDMRAAGDSFAAEVFSAMAYQVAREAGAAAVSAGGDVHAVVLTGGMANSAELVEEICARVSFLGRVLVYPGEEELEALNDYLVGLRNGVIMPMTYGG